MRELAAFVSSPAGEVYASICRTWGLDPGALLEPFDDVLAYNLRAGLAFRESPEEPDAHVESIEKLRRMQRG